MKRYTKGKKRKKNRGKYWRFGTREKVQGRELGSKKPDRES